MTGAQKPKRRSVKRKPAGGSRIEQVKQKISAQREKARRQAWDTAIDTAIGLVKLHRKTFDSTFKLIARLQDHSEKAVHELAAGAAWMPNEGKEVVEEWIETVRRGRVRFQKSVDKSFDLMREYFERVQAAAKQEPGQAGVSTAGKRKAEAKKRTAGRKAMARKKASPPDAGAGH